MSSEERTEGIRPLDRRKLRRRQRRVRRRTTRCSSRIARTTRPRHAPAEVALPAGAALGDAPVRGHGEHQVLGAVAPPHARDRAEPGDDHDGVHLPQRGRERPARGARRRGHRAGGARPPRARRRDPSTKRGSTLAGTRYSSWVARRLSSSWIVRAAQRVGRVDPVLAPHEPLAVAREPQPGQLASTVSSAPPSTGRTARRARLRLHRRLVVLQRLERVVVARPQQPRARAQVEREERVDAVGEPLDRQLVHRRVQRAAARHVGVGVDLLHPVEHLAAIPARVEAVAERAGLGVLVDDVEHLAHELEVRLRIEPPPRRVDVAVAQDPVVTGVVGEHRDARLAEVRAHHHHVVLQPPAPLREAEVVRVEEGAPPQLVRREEPDERLPGEVDAAAVAPEQVARHRLAVADDLADHDVGVVRAAPSRTSAPAPRARASRRCRRSRRTRRAPSRSRRCAACPASRSSGCAPRARSRARRRARSSRAGVASVEPSSTKMTS